MEDINTAAIGHTAAIVAAFVSRNPIQPDGLAGLISTTYAAVTALGTVPEEPFVEELVPAVPIRKRLTDEYVICLDDGLKFKSMKRHLLKLGMTPEQYRAKWGLPVDDPIVARSYSERRSQLAKANGLGTKR